MEDAGRTPSAPLSLPFSVTGTVIRGKQLGSQLGFPTANLRYDAKASVWPKEGVYAGFATVEDKRHLCILNQGKHPTSPDGIPTVETHLLDYDGGELYNRCITVEYWHYLRPEQTFSSLDALRAQLKQDKNAARQWAADHPPSPEENAGRKGVIQMEQQHFPIQLAQVSYQYDEESESTAVDKVSLTIEKGSFVAVLGHNGSGKSTMAKLMNAIYLPTEGKVLVCGMDTLNEEDTWNIRRHAGMVFQNPDNQIVANVVREDVAFGLENLGVPREEMIPRIDEALEAVRMLERADAAPHMLSCGQKQRVAIAGVLAMQPDVIIMDEATAMLDPSGRKDVLKTVRRLNRDKGMTVVWITHYMEEAALADRVVVLDKGKTVMDGTPSQVFSHVDEIRQLGLDVPPMAELALRLRNAGLPIDENILTVTDMVKELKNTLCPSKSST